MIARLQGVILYYTAHLTANALHLCIYAMKCGYFRWRSSTCPLVNGVWEPQKRKFQLDVWHENAQTHMRADMHPNRALDNTHVVP